LVSFSSMQENHLSLYYVYLICPGLIVSVRCFTRFWYMLAMLAVVYGGVILNALLFESRLPNVLNPFLLAGFAVFCHSNCMSARRTFLCHREATKATSRVSDLLMSVLPPKIVPGLLSASLPTFSDHFLTVVQSDLRGFTQLSSALGPRATVKLLNEIYSASDDLLRKYGLYKVEIIGDSIVACAGLFADYDDPRDRKRHARSAVEFALELVDSLADIPLPKKGRHLGPLQWRVGVHTGIFTGGIVGQTRIRYQLLGPAMRVVAACEAAAVAGTVLVSESTSKVLRSCKTLEFDSPDKSSDPDVVAGACTAHRKTRRGKARLSTTNSVSTRTA
jgi:class 3 adenylate cyclase